MTGVGLNFCLEIYYVFVWIDLALNTFIITFTSDIYNRIFNCVQFILTKD